MKANTSIFGFDPAIGCPFDDSEMKVVEDWRGFKVGMAVDTAHGTRGVIVAIGENAKFLDGEPFTAFAIKVGINTRFVTHKQIYHVVF